MHGTSPVRDNPKRRRRSRRRSNPAAQYGGYGGGMSHRSGLLDNPSYSGLFENPMGAYSMDSLKAFGIASAGVGLGLLVARGIDRFVATMKPADSKGLAGTKAANHPWYGKNAVAAINRRPGVVRLGVQAGGAVVGIGAAYALRNKPIVPWLLGGIALGFGSNLLLQLAEWYVIPRLFKIEKADEKTTSNRLYVLEQIDTQDKVDAIMEDWDSKPALQAQQAATAPVIVGPLNVDATGKATGDDIATLGRGAAGSRPSAPAGAPGGSVGGCSTCAACAYTVMPGDDLQPVLEEANLPLGVLEGLNGGGSPDSWWLAGNRVILPEAACHAVTRGAAQRRRQAAGLAGQPEAAPAELPPVASIPVPSILAAESVSRPFQDPSIAYALAGGDE
jgi:hypothetical protein